MYDAIEAGMTANTLQVPGATLYYKLRGTGPLLLVLPGDDGDADVSDGVTEYLTERYSVLTYDRRGLSRSPIADHEAILRLSTHSEDVHYLLAAVTSQPAVVIANSIGGLIGLDLVARHPEQVRLLIAHEPPILLGENGAPNAPEYLLHALAACLTGTIVYHAAARGIALDGLESTVEGDVDLHGFLGLDDNVRPGFEAIRVSFKVSGDIDDEQLAELASLTSYSPVRDIVSNPVPVAIDVTRA